MLESNLNTDLTRLFGTFGFSHKLPDPQGMEATHAAKRPFDGFARFQGWDFYFESKLIKNKFSAFDLDRVEPHQWENLLKLKRLGATAAITLGVWIPRKDYKLFVFDPELLYNMRDKSILGKQLVALDQAGLAISLRLKDLDLFHPDMLKTKMITAIPEVIK